MSYFVVLNHRGNIRKTTEAINARGVGGRFVLQFVPIKPSLTQIIFRFDSYQDYLWFCEKLGRTPVDIAEWSGALHMSHEEYQQSKRAK